MRQAAATRERAVTFGCGQETLVGVVCNPQDHCCGVGVIIVVGGPQYRVGSHRQFVLLARTLASEGFPTLRFDLAGMGDSTGERKPFDSLDDELRVAVDLIFREFSGVREVVLWALCDGASAVAMYLGTDPRVSGVVLVNPWVRSEASYAQAQLKHYYLGRLLRKTFWRRLLRGEVRIGEALNGLVGIAQRARGGVPEEESQDFRSRMAAGLWRFQGPVLFLMSGRDLIAREFDALSNVEPRWRDLLNRPTVKRIDIAEADHTFSRAATRLQAEAATVIWLRQRVAAHGPGERVRGAMPASA